MLPKMGKRLGKDVSNMVHDIERFEGSACKMDSTWAKGSDKIANWRLQNTMGYIKKVEVKVTVRDTNNNIKPIVIYRQNLSIIY